jgi:hypothetical protein
MKQTFYAQYIFSVNLTVLQISKNHYNTCTFPNLWIQQLIMVFQTHVCEDYPTPNSGLPNTCEDYPTDSNGLPDTYTDYWSHLFSKIIKQSFLPPKFVGVQVCKYRFD